VINAESEEIASDSGYGIDAQGIRMSDIMIQPGSNRLSGKREAPKVSISNVTAEKPHNDSSTAKPRDQTEIIRRATGRTDSTPSRPSRDKLRKVVKRMRTCLQNIDD
jgi:hypothetical protein